MRGKKGGAACGDRVEIKLTTAGQGVIETILPRSALLYRSDVYREKIIAANVTQMVIVVAAVPSFSEELINRCLAAAENQRIRGLIVLNKADLIEPTRAAAASLSLYRELGYPLLQISAKTSVTPLLPYLKGQLSVLVGQSGMGKSTLINTLIPDAERATAGISIALDSGCHTTTHARLFHLDEDTRIIDSPGMQEFGLHHIDGKDLAWEFIEFRSYLGQCKFNNCRHADEPGCALGEAAREGKISGRRLDFYRKLAILPGAMSRA
ncbi:ribosome small subunit-dependent GTPase A [Nitrosospira sp. Nsp13]|uniref:ribosome small subunit-dependent GTPase A n=1 Tax=Nitrosospira sp. Nsp13 TaxID=1855332 RepID=UPI000884A82E|nr:ribosome small subunit-dependent GTPase A [Nitrosospira sp. Nsp13]SCY03057.1 ribosome biogenesis GTPase [Nitrosospira sp. Nsp13]